MQFYLYPLLIGTIFLNSTTILSQINIELPDTIIRRGYPNKIQIPVYGSINKIPLNKIKILFAYKSSVIFLSQALGNDSLAMKSPLPEVNFDITKIDSTLIEVSDTNVQPINNGIICFLDLEGLAGSDSISYIAVKSIEINYSKETNFTTKPAIIKVTGAPVFEILPEKIGLISPNPFSAITELNFFIKGKTRVRFFIYSSDGSLMQDSWNITDKVKLSYFLSNGTEIEVDENYKFSPGGYKIIIEPLNWKMAAGLYYIIMQTENGLYYNNFIYWK
jgi:hypothetical protein